MRAQLIATAVVAGAMLCAGAAHAQLDRQVVRNPDPGTALAAAGLNLVYVPVHVSVTAAGAVLGGVTGWLTAGNVEAANSVWYVFDGPQVLQPEHLYGRQSVGVGDLQFDMHLTDPR